ncbi:Glycosyltransferase involved in cell wall bisynthesis [Faunimonas pinastri]|uniref:Glycosyltransferase involved in cell wall bisynthesis n=1 Tax=Faunimonas pinastri TaxID=1855383 RepID=A0A1H9FCF7_9HYPH|nr:glycosyltransferase family 1 protein [Faunimonas pinastri]SEQ35614.1 Glycosyltransferase involved in cell wall bisynthesis [Faunimonas pinastri]
MRLTIVTDAWFPQVNGVVHSLNRITTVLRGQGDEVSVVAPDRFRTVPCPTYPDIRLSLVGPGRIARVIDAEKPDHVHIATEGPLGMLARRHCLKTGIGFTTSYHTRFPEYVSARFPLPESWAYAVVRRFHNSGLGCMVATPSLEAELTARGFRHLMRWSRGVDADLFHPRPEANLDLPRPIFLNVGRVAVEKNLEAFCALNLPGSRVVVGDGPARAGLQARFPDVHFLGMMKGEALAQAYASADVFVFPSRTDTFGNVLLEALSSGLPVAAFPVTGPRDVITDPKVGVLDVDLRKAALAALELSGADARQFAQGFSWEASAAAFRNNILAGHGALAQKAA